MTSLAQIGPTVWAALCGAKLKSFWLSHRFAILHDAVLALTVPASSGKVSLAMLATIARERSAQDQAASFPPRWVQLLAKKPGIRPRETGYLTSLALVLNYLAEVNDDCKAAIAAQKIPLAALLSALVDEPGIEKIIRQQLQKDSILGRTAHSDLSSPRTADHESEPPLSASQFHPFSIIPPNNAEVDINFFRIAGVKDAMTQPRISYYVIYRHSTIKSHIVKTFLAVCSPLVRNTDYFTFVHVYTDPRREIKRISAGSIVSLHGTLYLTGPKAVVPFTDAAASVLSANGQVPIGHVQGMKMLAIPHARLTPIPSIATGVYLSNAGQWQPIVGRFAMVHLGFSTIIGTIDEAHAKIAIMDGEKTFKADLEEMSTKFPAMLGHHTLDEVCDYVLSRMTNVNQCDLKKRWRAENSRRALVPESAPPGIEPGR